MTERRGVEWWSISCGSQERLQQASGWWASSIELRGDENRNESKGFLCFVTQCISSCRAMQMRSSCRMNFRRGEVRMMRGQRNEEVMAKMMFGGVSEEFMERTFNLNYVTTTRDVSWWYHSSLSLSLSLTYRFKDRKDQSIISREKRVDNDDARIPQHEPSSSWSSLLKLRQDPKILRIIIFVMSESCAQSSWGEEHQAAPSSSYLILTEDYSWFEQIGVNKTSLPQLIITSSLTFELTAPLINHQNNFDCDLLTVTLIRY